MYKLFWIFKLYYRSNERIIGSTKSLLNTHMIVIINIIVTAIMSTRMENQLDAPEFIIIAIILWFNKLSLARMKSSYFLNARIVLAPEMLSPKRLTSGDLVVLLIL